MRAFLLCLCLIPTLRAQDNAVLDSWLKKQASIRTLAVTFRQIRTLPTLKQPVTTPGKLTFARPDKLRWEIGSPPATLAVSDGAAFTLIDVRKRSARKISADSPQASRFSLLAQDGFKDAAAFHASFRVTGHRVTAGLHQYTLQPLDAKLRGQLPWIFLTIDPATLYLRGFEIETKDKSRIRTEFGFPEINSPVPPEAFLPSLDGYTVR